MKEQKQILKQSGKAGLASTLPRNGFLASAPHMRHDGMTRLTAEVYRLMQRDFAGLWESRPQHFHLAINEAASLAWLTGVPELVFPALAQEKIQALAQWHCRQESLFRHGTTSVPAARGDACCRARVCPADWPAAPCRQSAHPSSGRWDMAGRNLRFSSIRL